MRNKYGVVPTAVIGIITIAIVASSRTIEQWSEEDMKKVGTTEAIRGGF